MTNEKTLKMYEPPMLTATEANALMVMLESDMEMCFQFDALDLDDWENLDLIAYKIQAFHNFKTWYHSQFKHKDIFEEKSEQEGEFIQRWREANE